MSQQRRRAESDPKPSWLTALLEPISLDEFASTHWRRRHLLCRGSAERFAGLLSWPVLNQILTHHFRETYRFRLARQGRDLDPSSYADVQGSTPRIRPADLIEQLRCGATLSFHAIDELHAPLTELAESFEAFFGGGTQINVYAGWHAVHGLDLHRDDEEVFILHVDGRKRWLLYGFAVDDIDRTDLDRRSAAPAGAALDEVLEPGDLLYIPRGCYHVALPMNEPALHVTVGIKTGSAVRPRPSFGLPSSVTSSGFKPAAQDGGPAPAGLNETASGESLYSVADYGAMIGDPVRMSSYVRALRQAVVPGCVVIDIGTGTGIFALLACRFGARRVYAIEPAAVIQVAREIAEANGCADRIEFIQALSTTVTLPERGDVIISDLGGALPWFQQHIPSIVDARRRLLAPGGVLIPQRDVAWAAVVDQKDVYARLTGPWDPSLFGLDMVAARRIVTNAYTRARLTPEHVLTEMTRWAALDYDRIEDPHARARLTWRVTRAGTAHGLALGMDRIMAEGVTLSNAPDAPDAIRTTGYPSIFFPWPAPVLLHAGDQVTVDLEARLVRRDYVWNWKTQVCEQGNAERQIANFSQSTFFGVPLSPATLRHAASRW